MGAAYTMKVTTRDSRTLAKDIVAVMKCQPDCSIECSGAQPSIATAIYVCMYGYMYVCICLYMYIYVSSGFNQGFTYDVIVM